MSTHDEQGSDRYADEHAEGRAAEEQRLRELIGTVRQDVTAPPALRAAVMREVARLSVPAWRRWADWLLRPRPVSISPAWGGSLAFAATAAIVLVTSQLAPRGAEPVADATVERAVTRFVLVAPEASSVHVTGDFAAWSADGIALQDLRGSGIWTVDVPLDPGTYQYTFIIDGAEWRPDPGAVAQVDDGFGQMNSLVVVTGNGEA